MENQKENENLKVEILDAMNKAFSRMETRMSSMEEKMVTKDDFQNFKTETQQRFDKVDSKIDQVSTDLKDFKTETRERFDGVDESIKELNENVEAVIEDYHPRINTLEEKVFGKPTLV